MQLCRLETAGAATVASYTASPAAAGTGQLGTVVHTAVAVLQVVFQLWPGCTSECCCWDWGDQQSHNIDTQTHCSPHPSSLLWNDSHHFNCSKNYPSYKWTISYLVEWGVSESPFLALLKNLMSFFIDFSVSTQRIENHSTFPFSRNHRHQNRREKSCESSKNCAKVCRSEHHENLHGVKRILIAEAGF